MAWLETLEPRLVMSAAILSEFVASNSNGLADADGDHPDWVELYNPTTSPVNLAGWSLTDNADDLAKWRLPAISLDPSGFLVVFASGKNRAVAGAELHTNFKLSASSGYLALVQPDGTVADDYGVTYPAQASNVSMGVTFDSTPLVVPGATAAIQVPTSGALDALWTLPTYSPDGSWMTGRTGVGYGVLDPGFRVDYYKANVGVDSLAAAYTVINTPAFQETRVQTSADAINYLGNGGGANFSGDQPFPTQSLGQDLDNFVIDVTGIVNIPSAGPWTFGVNSDDGFELILERNGTLRSFAFDGLRAPGDSLAVLDMPEPGSWNVRLVFFELGGGASVEFFAAPGSRPSFDGGVFRLVGAPGGLAVGSLLTGSSGDDALVARFVADDLNALGDEATVTAWADRDPDGNGTVLATASGAPTLVRGSLNGRSTIRFDSSQGLENLRIAAGSNPLVGALDFTAAIVFRTSTAGIGPLGDWYENAGLIDSDLPDETEDWGLTFNAQGRVGAGIGRPDVSVYSVSKGLNDGNAHLAVVTRSAGVLSIAIDGRIESEREDASQMPLTLADLVFGSLQGNVNGFLGEIAEVRLFNNDLTPREIRLLAEELDATYRLTGVTPATVNTDLRSAMQGRNATAFVRIPFQSPDPATFEALSLRMQYDDGFVAYLNGVEVARANAPLALPFNARALTAKGSSPTTVETFSLTPFLGLLRSGENLLAIRGLNAWAGDDDFLALPELSGLRVHPDEVRFFATPTPGAANANPYLGVVAPVTASVGRGFFSQPFTLTLSTPTAGAEIRYTTDGSEPSPTNGAVFSAPLTIGRTTALRANAFVDGYLVPIPMIQTYLFLDDVIRQSPDGSTPAGWPSSWGSNVVDYGMDPDVVNSPEFGGETLKAALQAIPSISVTTGLDNLFDASSGIYANAYQQGINWEREAGVELINPDGSPGFGLNAGLRIRGGYSRSPGNPKHAFRLFFRGDYGASSLDFPLFGAEGADSFAKVDLRTAQNYSWSFGGDPSNNFIAEVFARDTSRALGQPYTRSRFYHLYLDGQYWGLYQTEERPDANFGATYFGGSKDDYDVIKVETGPYTTQATDGNFDAWGRLYQAATDSKAPLSDNANYFKIQGKNPDGSENLNQEVLVDVDNLIDYMMVILYGGNIDSPVSAFLGNAYPNNFFAIRNRNGRQGFQFIQHDAEHTLRNVYEDRNGPFPAGEDFPRFNPQYLHQQLMANANYKIKFADAVQREFFGNGALTVQAATARFLSRAAEIDQAIIGESARWGDSYRNDALTRTDWLNAVGRVTQDFIPNRQAIFLDQLRAAGLLPVINAPSFLINGSPTEGGDILPGTTIEIASTGGVIYYTKDGTDPRGLTGGRTLNALVYDPASKVPLNASALITARVFQSGTWSAAKVARFSINVPATAENLAITEIHYNPLPANLAAGEMNVDKEEFEFLELQNKGATEIKLAGVKFTTGIGFDFTSSNITTLAPGAYVVVVKNLDAFKSRYGVSRPVAGVYGTAGGSLNSLSNGGERVVLVGATNAVIEDFTYDDAAPWPLEPDGLGRSLIRVSTSVPASVPPNWRASPFDGGSPGLLNNAAPTVTAIDDRSIDEDTATSPIVFTVGDLETPVAGLVVSVTSSNGALLPVENITLSGAGAVRTIVATPVANAYGTAEITVTVTDPQGGQTVERWVLAVVGVPDSRDDAYQTDEGVALSILASGGVLINDEVATGRTLAATRVALPLHGSLTLRPDGSFDYTPVANYHGTDTFTYRVSDGLRTGNTVRVDLTINSVPTPPVIPVIPPATVAEGAELRFTVGATDGDLPDDRLTFSAEEPLPQGASLDPDTGLFVWTPSEIQGAGVYTIKVRVTDRAGTFARSSFGVTVTEVNRPPVIEELPEATIPEGGRFTTVARATDPDLPANTIRYRIEPSSASGGTIDPVTGEFAWTPGPNQGLSRYGFLISAFDNGTPSLSSSARLFVTVVNVPPSVEMGGPVVIQAGQAISTVGRVTDTGPGPFTATVDYGDGSGPQPLLLAFDNTFALAHLYNADGAYTVTVRATDSRGGEGSATTGVSVSTPPVTLQPGSVRSVRGKKPASTVSLSFTGEVDPATVVNLSNYRLLSAGKDRKLGTRDDKVIALGGASYLASTRTVTLTTRGKLPAGKIKLVVTSGGLRDARGRATDGDRDGKAGGEFSANLTRNSITIASTPRPSAFSARRSPRR